MRYSSPFFPPTFFASGSPDQLGPTQKGPAWHGEVNPGPGKCCYHAKPNGLRPESQWSLSTATSVHLISLCQCCG